MTVGSRDQKIARESDIPEGGKDIEASHDSCHGDSWVRLPLLEVFQRVDDDDELVFRTLVDHLVDFGDSTRHVECF
jgi:hypothetical protein